MKNVKFLLIIVFVALIGCTKGPDKTAREFFENLADGKTDSAVKAVMPNTNGVSEGELRNHLGHISDVIKKANGLEKIEVVKNEVNGDSASVDLSITDKAKKTQKIALKLSKVDGKWLIIDMK